MVRILFFLIAVVAAALGLAWLADRPGSINVNWLGYEIETSAFVGVLVLAAMVALLLLAWSALRYLVTRPGAIAAYTKERKRRQGFDALSRGLIAIGVGDRALAQRYTLIARRNLPNEPLTALLRAQTAQLTGDRAAARRAFETMLDRPETDILALRGLYLEARRRDDGDAARALAEQAVQRDPKLAWSVNALFDLQARAGDWPAALDTLAIARRNGHVDAKLAARRRAALLTAEAREMESSDPDKALARATEALKLSPSLVPAAEIVGRLLAAKGEGRLASRIIARTWRLSPHPDLAVAYAFAKPGESPRERLKRMKHLSGLTPGDIEGAVAVAAAAIDAHTWQEARAALEPYLEGRPPARVCTLMARIEAGEGDKGREREWLARAVRAPRDRAWIADGYISDRWQPVSPVTGEVDAFEWKAPLDAIGRGDDTLLISDEEPAVAEPEERIRPLPAPIAPPPQAQPAPAARIEPVAPSPKPAVAEVAPRRETPPKPETKVFVPDRPPDDPGVASSDTEEAPASLERLRAAQIR